MVCNTGKADRIIRVVAGLGLIVFGLLNEFYIVAAIGLVPLITGAIGTCPVYSIFKIDTGCKKD